MNKKMILSMGLFCPLLLQSPAMSFSLSDMNNVINTTNNVINTVTQQSKPAQNTSTATPAQRPSHAPAQNTSQSATASSQNYGTVDMPKRHTINSVYMKNAIAQRKSEIGDDFVELIFMEPALRPFKQSKWPHKITHYSMKVATISKKDGKHFLKVSDMQIFGDGSSQSNYRFLTPMSNAVQGYVNYTK